MKREVDPNPLIVHDLQAIELDAEAMSKGVWLPALRPLTVVNGTNLLKDLLEIFMCLRVEIDFWFNLPCTKTPEERGAGLLDILVPVWNVGGDPCKRPLQVLTDLHSMNIARLDVVRRHQNRKSSELKTLSNITYVELSLDLGTQAKRHHLAHIFRDFIVDGSV
jgi:hypothetical protein